METFTANDLAALAEEVGNSRGHNVVVDHIENPRKELEEHYYNPVYQGLREIGVEPHFLNADSLGSIFSVVEEFKDSIRTDVIFNGIKWS